MVECWDLCEMFVRERERSYGTLDVRVLLCLNDTF